MSDSEKLIQSQQVTLTGPVRFINVLLASLYLDAKQYGVTVTLTPTSVPDATVGVTQDSQQNPRQWIGVDERLPRVGKSVWIVYQGVVQTVAYRLAGRGFGCEDGYEWMTVPEIECDPLTDMEAVTHWMPLPEPPDAQGSVTEQSQQKSRQEQPLRLTYEDCDGVDCRAAEQFAVAYVAQVGVSKETMIDAISTLRALVMTYDRRLTDAQGSVTEQSQQKSRQDGEA